MIGPGYYQTCGQMLNESGAASDETSLDDVAIVCGILFVTFLCIFAWFMLDRYLPLTPQKKQIEVIDTNNLQYYPNSPYNYHYGR